jgi:hypothetical protein
LLRLVASSIPSHPVPSIRAKPSPFLPDTPSLLSSPTSLSLLPLPLSCELSETGDRATSIYLRFPVLGVCASSTPPFLSSRDPDPVRFRTEAGGFSTGVDRLLRVSPWATAGAPRSAPTARRAAPSPHQGQLPSSPVGMGQP